MSKGDANVRYSATKSVILRQSPIFCDKVRYSAAKYNGVLWIVGDRQHEI